MVHSTRRFVLSLVLCHFVLVFFSPFNIAITSLGEKKANLSAFRTFVRFVLVWFCLFPLSLGVWEGLRLVTVALLELFTYLFYIYITFDLLFDEKILIRAKIETSKHLHVVFPLSIPPSYFCFKICFHLRLCFKYTTTSYLFKKRLYSRSRIYTYFSDWYKRNKSQREKKYLLTNALSQDTNQP